MADRSGLYIGTIIAIERRTKRPDDDTLFKLAKVLPVTASAMRADLNGEEA